MKLKFLLFSDSGDEKNTYKYSKYKKIEKPKIGYIFAKTTFPVICNTCGSNNEEIFKEEKSIEILISLDSVNNMKE